MLFRSTGMTYPITDASCSVRFWDARNTHGGTAVRVPPGSLPTDLSRSRTSSLRFVAASPVASGTKAGAHDGFVDQLAPRGSDLRLGGSSIGISISLFGGCGFA